MSLFAGRLFLTLAALATAIGPYIADWNATHVFNPRWPGHAKFHNGQTMSFGLCLGLAALWYLYTPAETAGGPALPPVARAQLARQRLRFAAACAGIYWVTQASAILYPGSVCVDPEFGEGCPQVVIDTVALTLVAGGYALVSRGIEGRAAVKRQ